MGGNLTRLLWERCYDYIHFTHEYKNTSNDKCNGKNIKMYVIIHKRCNITHGDIWCHFQTKSNYLLKHVQALINYLLVTQLLVTTWMRLVCKPLFLNDRPTDWRPDRRGGMGKRVAKSLPHGITWPREPVWGGGLLASDAMRHNCVWLWWPISSLFLYTLTIRYNYITAITLHISKAPSCSNGT